MKTLRDVLANCDEGKEYLVTFHSGTQLVLKDFEPVDKSIYGRDDLFVGWVVSQVKGDKRFFTPGSGIQFGLSEIKEVAVNSNGSVLYCAA